jgi:hypothetical protein
LVSNLVVFGHSFIQTIKTTKNCYDTVTNRYILPLAIWHFGLSDMFFSDIEILHQHGLYGAQVVISLGGLIVYISVKV